MKLSRRETAILLGAVADRQRFAAMEHLGLGVDRFASAKHNILIDDARNGIVPIDPARWLDREITPSQSTMNSRAYRRLEKLGLVERVNFWGERKTTHLKITEVGEQLAARLTANESPAAAT